MSFDTATAVTRLPERSQAMFGDQFGAAWTLEDLEASFRRYWPEPAVWWQAPTRWFNPGDSSAETGGIFTNDINRASSEYRDRHMASVLAEARAPASGCSPALDAITFRHRHPLRDVCSQPSELRHSLAVGQILSIGSGRCVILFFASRFVRLPLLRCTSCNGSMMRSIV